MSWFLLLLAGVLEIAWVVGLKHSAGFSRPEITIATLLAAALSLALLAQATKTLPLGAAYAIWTGIGVAGTAVASWWLFGEPLTVAKAFCVGLILAGVVGLKFSPRREGNRRVGERRGMTSATRKYRRTYKAIGRSGPRTASPNLRLH